MPTPIFRYAEEQQIDPKVHHGVDFGAEGRILLVNNLHELPALRLTKPLVVLWRKGSSYWTGSGGGYASAHLSIRNPDTKYGTDSYWLGQDTPAPDGMRLSKKLFVSIWPSLKTELGCKPLEVDQLHPRKTLIIDWEADD